MPHSNCNHLTRQGKKKSEDMEDAVNKIMPNLLEKKFVESWMKKKGRCNECNHVNVDIFEEVRTIIIYQTYY